MTTNPIGDRLAAQTRLQHVRAAAASAQFTVFMGGLDQVASHLTTRELAEHAFAAWREFVETPCRISKPLILDGFLRAAPYLTPQDAVTFFAEQFPDEVTLQHAGHVITWLPDDDMLVITHPEPADGSPAVPPTVIRGGTYAQMLAHRVA
ncbi:MAG: hypothetical protein LBE05_05905 [Microbacterium sp.]|jgi:hypothetical protein|nr:hypothetical protein [Microbacterium sp.]